MRILPKTRDKVAAKVTTPVRNASVLSVSAFVIAVFALLLALVRR